MSAQTQSRFTSPDDRAVYRWLVASALAVVLALVVGGITRLTESGLSITEWKPISGALPPRTDAAWTNAFNSYLQIPEAQTVHRGITLPQFKRIFWWEWTHRNLARLVGLVIAVPFFVLLVKRRMRPEHRVRLALLPLLVAAQGALGWYMVKSGLTGRNDVSQYRLVAHLSLALVVFVVACWTAMSLALSGRGSPTRRDWRAIALSALMFFTIMTGGFVAGMDAGHIYNSFPLMGGALVPTGYAQLTPLWKNWFENAAAVQFNHRLFATLTTATALALGVRLWKQSYGARLPKAWLMVAGAAGLQFVLGVTTLILKVPIAIAVSHQLGAVLLLTACLWAAQLSSVSND